VVAPSAGTKWVYEFSEGSKEMRDLLGGKGANVAEMTRVLGPDKVPAGFTITTEACVAYMKAGRVEPEGLEDEVADAVAVALGKAFRPARARRRSCDAPSAPPRSASTRGRSSTGTTPTTSSTRPAG
jgi:hypothetical protein